MRAIGTLRDRQQGMTFIGWVLMLMIFGFFVLLALKLIPTYLEYFRVVKQLSSLEEQGGLETKAAVEVRKLLLRRFSIDDIDSIPPDQIKIEKKERRIIIDLKWEVRTPMIGNVDALVTFHERRDFVAR
jgi:hypothetical protein